MKRWTVPGLHGVPPDMGATVTTLELGIRSRCATLTPKRLFGHPGRPSPTVLVWTGGAAWGVTDRLIPC